MNYLEKNKSSSHARRLTHQEVLLLRVLKPVCGIYNFFICNFLTYLFDFVFEVLFLFLNFNLCNNSDSSPEETNF